MFRYYGDFNKPHDRDFFNPKYNTREKLKINLLPSEEDDKLHWVWLRWNSKILNTDTHDHDYKYWWNQCWCVSYSSKAKLYAHFKLYVNNDHEAVRAVLPDRYK